MSNASAAHYYRRREREERGSAAEAGTAAAAIEHLELAEGYRALAEQAEQAALPAMRRMELRTRI